MVQALCQTRERAEIGWKLADFQEFAGEMATRCASRCTLYAHAPRK